jgi:hypothetical protein
MAYTGISTALGSVAGSVSANNTASQIQLVVGTIPTDFLGANTTFRVIADGIISTKSATVGTATWSVRIGTTTLTGNIPTSIVPTLGVSLSSQPWHVDFTITVITGTNSGTVRGNGYILGNLGTSNALLFKGTGTTGTVAIDCTASNIIELTFQWGTADSANLLTCYNAIIDNAKI